MPSYEKIIEKQAQEAAEERERIAREQAEAGKRAVYVQFWRRMSRFYCHRRLPMDGFPDSDKDSLETLETKAHAWFKQVGAPAHLSLHDAVTWFYSGRGK
jgi:hypothetical protein